MNHISIYNEEVNELALMMQALDHPGQDCGNDGCELAVTDQELEEIWQYVKNHPGKFGLDIHATSQKEIARLVENWQP